MTCLAQLLAHSIHSIVTVVVDTHLSKLHFQSSKAPLIGHHSINDRLAACLYQQHNLKRTWRRRLMDSHLEPWPRGQDGTRERRSYCSPAAASHPISASDQGSLGALLLQ